MNSDDLKLEKQVRDSAALVDRLEKCREILISLCVHSRAPNMSVPPQWYDEDIFIDTTLKDAIEALNKETAV